MADPKYANLPGIAVDQPDLYETNELPESDQHQDFDIEESDAVETLHISTNEAFGKFKGKNLDTSNVDFSDKIQKSKQKGYIAWTGDYELAGKDDQETLDQKYQRLNCEVRQLLEDLEDLKKSGAEKVGNQNLVGLAKQTAMLQDQLSGLKLEEYLGSDPVKDLQDPSGNAKKKLLTQIEQLKTIKSASDNVANKSNPESSEVMYELLMKPDSSKLEERQRLALFESRLEAVEKVLGPSAEKMSVLSVETNTKNISSAISVINSRLGLLEPVHLDHVEGRLAALLQKLNTVNEKKANLEDTEKNNKIAELYEMVTANQSVALALPEVVDRLDSLQALHEQSLQFSKTLLQLDSLQQKLQTNLSTNEKVLQETQGKFSENLETIQKNFDAMDQRLNKLKK
eukprot:06120.XXX_9445_10891_1 [CDS] Oithona nana genome sequencing.